MMNVTEVIIEAFLVELRDAFHRSYGRLEPDFPEILAWAGRMALESIANTDAVYHDVEHTILVTTVGQDILFGKHLTEGGVTPRDWLHFVISLLCHDIGYVRGVCRADRRGSYATGRAGEMVSTPPGASDAAMTPYHIDRGKLFIRERFGAHRVIDAEVIAQNIENTRFPLPDASDCRGASDYPALVRAADLIGQLADPGYLRKLPALFQEFQETGANAKLGYRHPGDLRDGYPKFFWNAVNPYVVDGLRHLTATQRGRDWIAHLHSHVFAVEHDAM